MNGFVLFTNMRNTEIHTFEQTQRVIEQRILPEERILGQRLLIPKGYLFGTQEKADYCYGSEKRIKDLQKDKRGMLWLLQNPALVIAIPEEKGLGLYISDGHHRSRYCSRAIVPSIVFPDDIALYIINGENKRMGNEPISLNQFRDVTIANSKKAIDSFSTTLPESKYPHVVSGAFSVRDLAKIAGFRPY